MSEADDNAPAAVYAAMARPSVEVDPIQSYLPTQGLIVCLDLLNPLFNSNRLLPTAVSVDEMFASESTYHCSTAVGTLQFDSSDP